MKENNQAKIDMLILQAYVKKDIISITGWSNQKVSKYIKSSNLIIRKKHKRLTPYIEIIKMYVDVGYTYRQIEEILGLEKREIENYLYNTKTTISEYKNYKINPYTINPIDIYCKSYCVKRSKCVDGRSTYPEQENYLKWCEIMNDLYIAIIAMMIQTGKSYYSKYLGEFVIKRTKTNSVRKVHKKLFQRKGKIFKETGVKLGYKELLELDYPKEETIVQKANDYDFWMVWYKRHKAFRFRNQWLIRFQKPFYHEILNFINDPKNRKYLHKMRSQ